MEPRQALQLIDQVAASFQGTRTDHQNLQVAIAVLSSIVGEKEVADNASRLKSPGSKTASGQTDEAPKEQAAKTATQDEPAAT